MPRGKEALKKPEKTSFEKIRAKKVRQEERKG
jgi:hypothetical protein